MNDYKELIEDLRFRADHFDMYAFADGAADAIESLVRERDEAISCTSAQNEIISEQFSKLSAIRAAAKDVVRNALDKAMDGCHPCDHGNDKIAAARLSPEMRKLYDAINCETQPTTEQFSVVQSDHIRDATKMIPAQDSREAFEAIFGKEPEGEMESNLWHADLEVWNKALAWRDSQQGKVTVTKNEQGQIVAVTLTDDEHRILKVIAESNSQPQAEIIDHNGWVLREVFFSEDGIPLACREPKPQAEPVEWAAYGTPVSSKAEILELFKQSIDAHCGELGKYFMEICQPDGKRIAFLAGPSAEKNAYQIVSAITRQPRAEVPEGFTDKLWKDVCTLQRYSFFLVDGLVRRVPDKTGNWLELNDVQKIVDHDRIAAMLQSAPKKKG